MRVLVAMSGGVDSSVAASLVKKAGHEVIGLALRLSSYRGFKEGQEGTCCAPDDLYDARRVAQMLEIPFYVMDARREFEEHVIAPFVVDYLSARTPNPCVICNDTVKFDRLLELADQLGADALATGHYARVDIDPMGRRILKKARDVQRDQTYFLFRLDQDRLSRIMFPLGELTKPEVRALAEQEGFPTASKHDSQELCFVSKNDYAGYIESRGHSSPPGNIVDQSGKILGQHSGLLHYTVGQRKGLGIAAPAPLYVLALDAERNQVVVGSNQELFMHTVVARDMVWSTGRPVEGAQLAARIRYRAQESPARVTPMENGLWKIQFASPQRAITPGQAIVLYEGDLIRGGGWIVGTGENPSYEV